MKTITLVACAFLFAANISAQSIPNKAGKKNNELGIDFDHINQSIYSQSNGIGILYKYWFKNWQAIRVLSGYQHDNSMYSKYSVLDNKLFRYDSKRSQENYFFSFGIEAQRHFDKRVLLYAGLDAKCMMGHGFAQQKGYIQIDSAGYRYDELVADSTQTVSMRSQTIALLPLLGAKLNFKRISFGVEATTAFLGYRLNHSANRNYNYSLFDLSLGNISDRIFITYRF